MSGLATAFSSPPPPQSQPRYALPNSTTPKCPQGCDMTHNRLQVGFVCDKCKKQRPSGGSVWSCRTHDVDFCHECVGGATSPYTNSNSHNNNNNNQHHHHQQQYQSNYHQHQQNHNQQHHNNNQQHQQGGAYSSSSSAMAGLANYGPYGGNHNNHNSNPFSSSMGHNNNNNNNNYNHQQPLLQNPVHNNNNINNMHNNNNNSSNAFDDQEEGYLLPPGPTINNNNNNFGGAVGNNNNNNNNNSSSAFGGYINDDMDEGYIIPPTTTSNNNNNNNNQGPSNFGNNNFNNNNNNNLANNSSMNTSSNYHRVNKYNQPLYTGGNMSSSNNNNNNNNNVQKPNNNNNKPQENIRQVCCYWLQKQCVRSAQDCHYAHERTGYACQFGNKCQHGHYDQLVGAGTAPPSYDLLSAAKKNMVDCPVGHQLVKGPLPQGVAWMCDICNKKFKGGFSFACREKASAPGGKDCEFDMCAQCVTAKQYKLAKLNPQPSSTSASASPPSASASASGSTLAAAMLMGNASGSGSSTNSPSNQHSPTQNSNSTTSTGAAASSSSFPIPAPSSASAGGNNKHNNNNNSNAKPQGPQVLCRKGHLLAHTLLDTDVVWKCDNCQKTFPKGGDSHGCRKCDWDCCSTCFAQLQRVAALPATFPCQNDHPMMKSECRIQWTCSLCKLTFHRAANYRCTKCSQGSKNFDMCVNCVEGKIHDPKWPPNRQSSSSSSSSSSASSSSLLSGSTVASSSSAAAAASSSSATAQAIPCRNSGCPCSAYLNKTGNACCRSCKPGTVCKQPYHQFKPAASSSSSSTPSIPAPHSASASAASASASSSTSSSSAAPTLTADPAALAAALPGLAAPKTGKQKSLFVGINYPGTAAALRGCVNDVGTCRKWLASTGFDMRDTRVLVDFSSFPGRTGHPDRKSIEEGFKWVVRDAKPGDTLFCFYAGHGTLAKDDDGDEEDGFDSCLVPADYKRAGLIRDDFIFDCFKTLPAGVRVTFLCDCCKSGSVADLPWTWKWQGEEKQFAPLPRKKAKSRDFMSSSNKFLDAWVLCISGCKDCQTSADVSNVGQFVHNYGGTGAGGAMTNSMCEAYSLKEQMTFMEFFFRIQEGLKIRQFAQIPQLSSSHKLDMTQMFSIYGPLAAKK